MESYRLNDRIGRKRVWALGLGVVGLGTVLPRLMVIGGPPTTDEGIYAAQAQFLAAGLSAGHGLPDAGPLMLYPLLTAWVFRLTWNPLVLLRLVDLAVACATSWLFYRVIRQECRSRVAGAVIACLFLWVMNQLAFIQSGYRNSIFCAEAALFLAFLLVQDAPADKTVRWGLAGSLTGLAVLLREPLFPFAIAGSIAAAATGRWRCCLAFTLGGLAAAAIVVSSILAAGRSLDALQQAYRDYGSIYAALDGNRWRYFLRNGLRAALVALPALIMAGGGLFLAARAEQAATRSTAARRRLWFWLAVTLLPLWEPLAKIGFPYHFALCLPGLAGSTAFGWRYRADAVHRIKPALLAVGAGAIMLLVAFDLAVMARQARAAAGVLGALTSGTWPAESIARSNYLRAAEAIRAAAPQHATVSTSGFFWGLLPLTGLLPPSFGLADLNSAAIVLRLDESRLRTLLVACPPDVLLVTNRAMPGTDIVKRAVIASGLFQPVGDLPITAQDTTLRYGGTIYRRIAAEPAPCTGQ